MTCPHCAARSSPQHRRYFKMIETAYQHWPESGEFRDANHLRSWLQMKAGYFNRIELEDVTDITMEYGLELVTKIMKITKNHAWVKPHPHNPDRWFVFTPVSIAYDKMDRKEFNELNARVENIICDVLKVPDGDTLLREHGRAA
jgi:hypothetical protein